MSGVNKLNGVNFDTSTTPQSSTKTDNTKTPNSVFGDGATTISAKDKYSNDLGTHFLTESGVELENGLNDENCGHYGKASDLYRKMENNGEYPTLNDVENLHKDYENDSTLHKKVSDRPETKSHLEYYYDKNDNYVGNFSTWEESDGSKRTNMSVALNQNKNEYMNVLYNTDTGEVVHAETTQKGQLQKDNTYNLFVSDYKDSNGDNKADTVQPYNIPQKKY